MKAYYIKDITEEKPLLSLQDIRDVFHILKEENVEISQEMETLFYFIKVRYFEKYNQQTS